MKTIVLKVINLNGIDEYFGKLKHISFQSYEGELCSFIGLNKSEIRALFDCLCGNIELDWSETVVCVKNRRIYNRKQLQSQVYALSRDNYGLREWTIAEYLWLNQIKCGLLPGKMKQMEMEAEKILRELNISWNVRGKVCDMDPLEKRMLEVIKGICYGASILMIGEDDFFGGMTEHMIKSFDVFLKRVIRRNMTAIMLGGTDTSMIEYPDFAEQTIIMRNGSIIRKINTESTVMPSFQEMIFGEREWQDSFAVPKERILKSKDKNCFSVRSIKKQMEFPVGSISVIICRDNLRKRYLYDGISGRLYAQKNIPEDTYFWCSLEGVPIKNNFFSFLKCKVISLDLVGTRQDVFENFSVEDNILLPSIDKFTIKQYIKIYQKLKKVIRKESRLQTLLEKRKVIDLNVNDRICLILERWMLYKPKVLILFEPFLNSDTQGVSLILKYLNKYRIQGTAVIIIKSNAEYVGAFVDQMLFF